MSQEREQEQLYRQYLDELSGEAARRLSIENACQEQRELEEDLGRWVEEGGSPCLETLSRGRVRRA